MSLEKGISIIICCYNSATRLPATLQHLAHQKLSDFIAWEIIIVNNASADNTRDVAYKEWGKYNKAHVQFSVVDELKSGLSFARKKGIEKAAYKYFIVL